MAALAVGVEVTGVQSELPAALSSALQGEKARFLVVPLSHPRYRRDFRRPRNEPMTHSDLQLHSQQWGEQVVGKLSPWLQLDAASEPARRRSEVAFRDEISWASHLTLQAVLLPPPSADCVNYARVLSWAAAATQQMQLLVRVHLCEQRDEAELPPLASGDLPVAAESPWRSWDRLRSLCEFTPALGVALVLSADLPEDEEEVTRWRGEPIRALLLPTSTFTTNKKGYPVLTRRHQAVLLRLLELKPKVIICGRADSHGEGLGAYLAYVRHVCSRLQVQSEEEAFVSPYYDYLQAPLQPLADNLESQTYETFEKDPIKYAQYQEAIRRALMDRHKPADEAGAEPAVVMVVGAGRGPLVAAAIAAAEESGRRIKLFAVEKNSNAVVTLQNRCLNEPKWAEVTVVPCDMRDWKAPLSADMLVSELLGSWGDNELSPECIDGAQAYLKPGGISIPCDYTSYIAPLSSSKLWNEVKTFNDLKHFETPYVVKVHNAFQMTDSQPVFRFEHPSSEPNPDNTRFKTLRFEPALGATMHGFVGFFHSTLYADVCISTDPDTESIGMFSWFPLYMPLRHPVQVEAGATVEITFWRQVDSKKVWYEWALQQPQVSPIHNPNGRSYHIGL